MQLSVEVEVKTDVLDWGDGETETQFYIRKKATKLKEKYIKFFGFNIETIKQLTKTQFQVFLKNKQKFENTIIDSKKIIVTTIGKACTHSLRERKFKRVIMDEATMVKENEAFLGAIHAEQIVLVGD